MNKDYPPVVPHQRATVRAAIRQFCLWCLNRSSGREAFDCCVPHCPLYCCHPFRDKRMAKAVSPSPGPVLSTVEGFWETVEGKAELAHLAECAKVPKRRPTRKMIAQKCLDCQAGERRLCHERDCPLWPLSPVGGREKRAMSEKQRAALAKALAASPISKRG